MMEEVTEVTYFIITVALDLFTVVYLLLCVFNQWKESKLSIKNGFLV